MGWNRNDTCIDNWTWRCVRWTQTSAAVTDTPVVDSSSSTDITNQTTTDSKNATTAAVTDTSIVDSGVSTSDVADTTAQTTTIPTDSADAVTDTPVVDSSSSTDNTNQKTDPNTQSDTTDQGYVPGEALLEQQPSKVISNGVVGFQIDKVEIEVSVNNYFGDVSW